MAMRGDLIAKTIGRFPPSGWRASRCFARHPRERFSRAVETGARPRAARLAGAAGFEPAHGGTKNRCLTTWLRPKALNGAEHSQARRALQRFFHAMRNHLLVVCLIAWVWPCNAVEAASRSLAQTVRRELRERPSSLAEKRQESCELALAPCFRVGLLSGSAEAERDRVKGRLCLSCQTVRNREGCPQGIPDVSLFAGAGFRFGQGNKGPR